MSIYDTLCVYQLQLVKAIQQTTKLQEDYKQKFNTFYSNLLDYLGSQKKAKYSQTTIIYLNNFKTYLKLGYLNSLFVELKLFNIDYYIEKLANDENDSALNEILAYIKKIDVISSGKIVPSSKSIKMLNNLADEELKLAKRIDSIDTTHLSDCFLTLNLLDFLFNYIISLFNHAHNLQIFSQSESFLKLTANLILLNFKLIKFFYNSIKKNNSDESEVNTNNVKCMKQILYKPLNQVYNIEKLFECFFKASEY